MFFEKYKSNTCLENMLKIEKLSDLCRSKHQYVGILADIFTYIYKHIYVDNLKPYIGSGDF